MANNENSYTVLTHHQYKPNIITISNDIFIPKKLDLDFVYFRWCKHRDSEDVVMDDPITFSLFQ